LTTTGDNRGIGLNRHRPICRNNEVFTFAISRVLMRFRAGLVARATP
jgi:hypothetical protein